MDFTEDDKAFIMIFVPNYRYGLRNLMTEFPKKNGKKTKRSGLDNLITKLLKKSMSERKHNNGILRTVRRPN